MTKHTDTHIEIERKFLVKTLPEHLENYTYIHMIQGYLSTSPVVRVRKENDTYVLTYKGERLLKHTEYNLPLTSESFTHLLKKCDGIIIEKVRYQIPLENQLIAELDIFKGTLEGLTLVEVEFVSEDMAYAFIPPTWFGEDVTHNERYYNSWISIHGKA